MRLFIIGCDENEDENQSPVFSLDSACDVVLTQGGTIFSDALLLLTWITKVIVECIVEPQAECYEAVIEGIRQYDSSDTGHSDNVNIAAEHQEPAEVLSQLDNTSNSPVYGEYKCW